MLLCDSCKTLHHRECWRANSGCTTLHCGGIPSAVVVASAEPIMQVSLESDLEGLMKKVDSIDQNLCRMLDVQAIALQTAVEEMKGTLIQTLEGMARNQEGFQVRLAEVLLKIRALESAATSLRLVGAGRSEKP